MRTRTSRWRAHLRKFPQVFHVCLIISTYIRLPHTFSYFPSIPPYFPRISTYTYKGRARNFSKFRGQGGGTTANYSKSHNSVDASYLASRWRAHLCIFPHVFLIFLHIFHIFLRCNFSKSQSSCRGEKAENFLKSHQAGWQDNVNGKRGGGKELHKI